MADRATTPDDNVNPSTHRISAARLALKNFHSQWFLAPQGTGILAVILHQLHYQFNGLTIISQILWVLTIIMLVVMSLLYVARALVFPSFVKYQLAHDTMETACLSSFVIAYTTVIQMITLNLVTAWGPAWGMVAYVMWWTNLLMATVAVIGITYVFTKVDAPGVDNVPIAVLLPLIASLTAAAGGGVVCRYGQLDATLQMPVLIVSYLSIGLSLPLSLILDAVFLVRLLDGKEPTAQRVFSLMILCGPLGQSSFALQILGDSVGRGVFAEYNTSNFISAAGGQTVAITSEFLALLTWGYGTFWWGFACIGIVHAFIVDRKALLRWDQNLAAWSLVFPWGVYTNAAVELGTVLQSPAYNVWSTVLTIMLVILWLLNMSASLVGIANGKVLGLQRGWRSTYTDSSVTKKE